MMDAGGNIYEIPEHIREELLVETKEDVARLDGYLRARAEADAPNRAARRKALKRAAKKQHGKRRR